MRKWVAPDAWPERLCEARERAVRGKSAVAMREQLERLVQAGQWWKISDASEHVGGVIISRSRRLFRQLSRCRAVTDRRESKNIKTSRRSECAATLG